jgi:hypothetical protein
MRKKAISEGMVLKGFARLQIHDYGPNGEPFHKLVSDTGIIGPNQKTNVGFQNFLNYVLGASAGSLLVAYAGIGTGGTPASNATSLTGETMARKATTYSAAASTTVQWVASWASSDITGSFTVGNAGCFNSSSGGSLAWGISTPGQTVNTNQSVSLTYQLSLS